MRPVLWASAPTTGEFLSSVLELVGYTVPAAHAEKWSPLERYVVYDWAWREHLSASDNPVQRRPRPFLLEGFKNGG